MSWKEYKKENDGSEYLTIYKQEYFKNGKLHKRPTTIAQIIYEPYRYSHYEEKKVICGKNKMPFYSNHKAFGYFGSAGKEFFMYLRDTLKLDIPEP